MKSEEKIMLAEHILEVRHAAAGAFLDMRGKVADYIVKEGFLPHWKIDSNVVNFRDQADVIKLDGAFVGYKSAGYVVLNPQTRNYFVDRATAFWKLLLKHPQYQMPEPNRFGTRTKIFIPSKKTFDEVNKKAFDVLFAQKTKDLIGGNEIDFQFIIEQSGDGFEGRIVGGPIHKEEAERYFQFKSDDLKLPGFLLDIDLYKTEGVSHDVIPNLLKAAVDGMWKKAERIASGLGL